MAARSLRSLALVMSALGTLVLTQGCADDGVSLHAICPIAPDIDGDSCTYDAAGTTCVYEGIMNLSATDYYGLTLRMESGLRARARDIPPQSEPNGLLIESARVELRSPSGDRLGFGIVRDEKGDPVLDANGQTIPVPNPFEVAATGYIPPSGSGGIVVTVITPEHARVLSSSAYAQVVASIVVKAKTNGQQSLESGE
jgi:hypothetical protein